MFYSLAISNNINVLTSIQLSHQEDSWRLSRVDCVQYYVKLAYLLLSDKCIPNCWNTSIYWGETWSMLVRNGEPLEYKHKEEETSVSVN